MFSVTGESVFQLATILVHDENPLPGDWWLCSILLKAGQSDSQNGLTYEGL